MKRTRKQYVQSINQMMSEFLGFETGWTEGQMMRWYAHELPIIEWRFERMMLLWREAERIKREELNHLNTMQQQALTMWAHSGHPMTKQEQKDLETSEGMWNLKKAATDIWHKIGQPITEEERTEYAAWKQCEKDNA